MDKKIKVWFQKYKLPSIMIGCLMLIGIITVIGISVAKPSDGDFPNQVVEGLSFENANLKTEDGITTFTAEIVNESGNIITLKTININIKNASDEIITLIGYVGEQLETNESKLITASIDKEITDASQVEYTINH